MNVLEGDKFYPRVLLVNVEPISSRYATGITMGNLFRGWPKDRIAQIYCDDKEPDTVICDRSWHLEIEDLRMPEWLREKVVALRKRRKQKKEHIRNQERIKTSEYSRIEPSFQDHFVQTLIKWFLKGLEFSSYRISPNMDAWIKDFRPEVIYSVLGNLHLLKLVRDLSDNLSIPVVPHFMDDWIVSLYPKGLLDKSLKYQLLKINSRIIRDARVMMVISEYMAEEYQYRYGRVFLPFMNCVDINYIDNQKRQISSKEEFRFVYTGGLHLGRLEVLMDIAKSLSVIATFGKKAVIDVYSTNIPDDMLKIISTQETIRYCGIAQPSNINNIITNADGLLHVESFEEKYKYYTMFSVSTKLPEYFSSGTAIFSYGPGVLASFKYISDNNCGVVVGDRGQSLLIKGLQDFISNDVLRSKMAENAKNICKNKHDACRQREKFRLALAQCPDN